MSKTLSDWDGCCRFAVAALATACTGELPAGPDSDMAALAAGRVKQAETEVCANLAPPEGNRVFRRLYANGAQVSWNGTSWTFVEPDAVLSADPKGRSTVGAITPHMGEQRREHVGPDRCSRTLTRSRGCC